MSNQPLNMAQFIAPKSDQINADDLIGGPRTIRISHVSANEGSPEQPISVSFDGDAGKPFKPCKSMRRVMVNIWGPDASRYVGRSMTLYRDPKVQFGGMAVGGIRISHMTDIPDEKLDNGKVIMALTAARAKRAPYTVFPLTAEKPAQRQTPEQWAAAHREAIEEANCIEDIDNIERGGAKAMTKLAADHPALHAELTHALSVRRSALSSEGRADEEHGDQYDGAETEADDWTK